MGPLHFEASTYILQKNASVQPAQTIEPTKEQIQSDTEGAFHGSMDTTQDELSENLIKR